MGMNFTNVTNAIQQIASNAGTPGIKVFWETAIGYSIYDFGFRISDLRCVAVRKI